MEHPARQQFERSDKAMRAWYPAFEKVHLAEPKDSPFYAMLGGCVPLVLDNFIEQMGPEATRQFFGGSREALVNLIDSALTLASWRPTQGIYRIHETLYQDLIESPLHESIPVEAIIRLPEWCVYLETPGLIVPPPHEGKPERPICGVWARLCDLPDSLGGLGLVLMIHQVNKIVIPFPDQYMIPLMGGKNLMEIIEWSFNEKEKKSGFVSEEVKENTRCHVQGWMPKVLSLLLYLCTVPEYSKKGVLVPPPENPQPKKIKGGVRLFPAQHPTTWEVGVRLGAALQTAYKEESERTGSSHGSPRGHIRRGHWHGYRTGPLLGPDKQPIPAQARDLKIVWQAPIPVNVNNLDSLPAVVRKVK